MMTSSAEDAAHADWSVTREDVQRWYAMHPETFPGFDVAPIILNERRQAAADKVQATYRDLPEVLILDQLKELSDRRKSMADELVERIAAYLPLPMGEASAVLDARLLPRRSGRPAWSWTLFSEHWRVAVDAATGNEDVRRRRLGGSPSLADIAVEFRRLDDTRGMETDSLRRLRRRFMPKSSNKSPAVRSVLE